MIGLAGAARLTRSDFRLNLLLLKGQRCVIWVPSALILCRSDRNFLFLQPFYISFVLSFSEGQKRKGAYTKERCRYKRKGADTKEKVQIIKKI